MFRPSIARKVIRLRSCRLLTRSYAAPHLFAPRETAERIQPPRYPLYEPDPEPMTIPAEELDEQLEEETSKEWKLKLRLTSMAEADAPELDEADLLAFYQALVVSGGQEADSDSIPLLAAPKDERISPEKRKQVIRQLEQRLSASGILAPLQETHEPSTSVTAVSEDTQAPFRIATALSTLRIPSSSPVGFSVKGKEKDVPRPSELPLGLITRTEWEALFESFMAVKDTRAAEGLMGVMIQHNVSPREEWVHRVLRMDAFEGRTEEIARLTTGLAATGNEITDVHHNAFLTSVLSSSKPKPLTAITYLREFERLGTPLPQESYNIVLGHLTTPSAKHHTTSHSRALAWDLFAHMRLHAYPIPSKELYSTMIRVCADARDPQPERARDLWIEMTTEGNKVAPTRDEYDAIIRALGSTKNDYLEAFELFRQMLAQHHDAVLVPFEESPRRLWSAHVPTLETFSALTEGTKRAGDIERARWVLSELVGLVRSSILLGQPMQGPDEQLMSGVFMTYASWKPHVSRRAIKLREGGKLPEGRKRTSVEKDEAEETATELDAGNLEDIAAGSYMTTSPPKSQSKRHAVPKTSTEALAEAEALFHRILSDSAAKKQGQTDFLQHPFTNVTLRPRLVNSYLTVHLEHAPSAAAARRAWEETWKQVAEVQPEVEPNGWSHLILLERCASGKRKGESATDKAELITWGKQAWKEYLKWAEDSPLTPFLEQSPGTSSTAISTHRRQRQRPLAAADKRRQWLQGLAPRQVEKCWKAGIKLHALTDDTTRSLATLSEFHKRFPPEDIKETYVPLLPSGLESRLTDTTALAEPDVPPHLLFSDVDVLHQRLVRKEDWRGVGLVKYIVTSYESALQKRRKWRRTNLGVAREQKKLADRSSGVQKRIEQQAESGQMGEREEEQAWEGIDIPGNEASRRRTWGEIMEKSS